MIIGDEVFLVSDPSVTGIVIAMQTSRDEKNYKRGEHTFVQVSLEFRTEPQWFNEKLMQKA